jgi:hypothetical protein
MRRKHLLETSGRIRSAAVSPTVPLWLLFAMFVFALLPSAAAQNDPDHKSNDGQMSRVTIQASHNVADAVEGAMKQEQTLLASSQRK